MARRQVKMSDIASKCGVSVSAVSLALRNHPSISVGTRQNILNAAQELGYHSRGFSPHSDVITKRLHKLGLIVKTEPNLPPQLNPFYSQVLAGIEATCHQNNTNLLYAILAVDENNYPLQVPRLLVEENVDGLLVVGAFLDNVLSAMLTQKSVPIVLVDAYALAGKYDAVVSDNVQGACQAVNHLIQRGHRHIGLVGGSAKAYPSLRERRQGYSQALKACGLTEYLADCAIGAEAATQATLLLLQQNPQISAVFGCNDLVSLAAMRAVRTLGRRVPQDVSVIGFDDIDLAQHVAPRLTTICVDKVGMGRMAVQLLVNRVKFPDAERIIAVIHSRLVERESVANLALDEK